MFRGRVLEVVLSGEQMNSLGGLCGMIIMNCFCGMVDRRKAFFNLISSWNHCQRSSPSRVSNTLGAVFESAQNLSPGLAELSCAVVITTAPQRH